LQAFEKKVMNFQVPQNAGIVMSRCTTISFSKINLLLEVKVYRRRNTVISNAKNRFIGALILVCTHSNQKDLTRVTCV
jgi:hypothetical protein